MLCTSARVVPNDDGKPNDHLIPFGLRDIRMTCGAMPRSAVRVAASAPCGPCATAINASADNSNPDEGMSGRHAGPVSAWLGPASSSLRSVLFDVLHNRSYIFVTRLHAIYCWYIFAI